MNNLHNYNLILMIEDTVSSKIYKEEIEQLKDNLNNQHDFLSVTVYHFDKNKNEKLVVKDSQEQIVDIKEDIPEKNNLVMIVSDVCSKIWHNNQVYETINSLSENSLVSIINVLPKIMWRGLAVDTFLEVKSTLPVNIKNNEQIINKVPSYLDAEELEHIIIMPMVQLQDTEKLLYAINNGGQIQTTYLYDDNLSLLIEHNQQPQSVKKLIHQYTARVFQPAVSFAQYLSDIESFTISDLEYVRKHMLPDTDKSVVAQFLLGGIVDKYEVINSCLKVSYSESTAKPSVTPQEQTRYKIKSDVAEQFKKFLNSNDNDKVKLLLQEKLNENQQTSIPKLKM